MTNLVTGGNVQSPRSSQATAAGGWTLWDNLAGLAQMIGTILFGIMILGVLGLVITLVVMTMATQANARSDELSLSNAMTTAESNINSALHNGTSIAQIRSHANIYLVTTPRDTTLHITDAVCKASQSANTYALVGLYSSQKYYTVYDSVTKRTVSGTYTNTLLVPDAACQQLSSKIAPTPKAGLFNGQ